jgi:hypothetical protein
MPASFASMPLESDSRRFGNPLRFKLFRNRSSGGWVGSSDLYFGHDVESAATIVLGSNAPAPCGGKLSGRASGGGCAGWEFTPPPLIPYALICLCGAWIEADGRLGEDEPGATQSGLH